MNKAVSLQIHDRIAVVTIDEAPVNALSTSIRQGLIDAAKAVRERSDINAVIFYGGEGRFIAGADIREMNKSPVAPFLPDVVAAIEAIDKPVIAAIDGAALGGGLEIALACDMRLVSPRAILGLTETRLGIIPGSGGTQRLPRLVGIAKAIRMIGEGQMIKAQDSVEMGLADELVEADVLVEAFKRATKLQKRLVRLLDIPADQPGTIEQAIQDVMKKAKGVPAIAEVIRVIQAVGTDFAAGMKLERESFLQLRASAEAKALRHLFFAERQSSKISGQEGVKALPIERVAVVGAGTMGSGITLALVDAGLPTLVLEMNDAAAACGRERIEGLYRDQIKKGRLSEEGMTKKMALITVSADWNKVADCQLVIEAAFEDMAVKKTIFEKLDQLTSDQTILATNTSYLDIDEIASFTKRPEKVVGLHFFSPAHIMRLLEVVRGGKTAAMTLATALMLAKKIKKIPVVAGNCDGFIGNRIYAVYRRHAEYLLEDGAMPWEIDAALESFGFAMGIFAVSDLSGLDIAYAMRKRRAATRSPAERYVTIADTLCEMGRLGRKNGAGWYDYDETGKRIPSIIVKDVVEQARRKAKITPKTIAPEDIQHRLLAVMVNEGAKILEEGIAERASDIDLAFVNGYSFPRLKGGPMFAAGEIGLPLILQEVEQAYKVGGSGSEPAKTLKDYSRDGRVFV